MSVVRHVPLDAEAVAWAAAEQGINSESELARRAKIDQSNLSKMLRGHRRVLPSHVLALAKALKVEPETLIKSDDGAVVS